jgi:hypothetical protein
MNSNPIFFKKSLMTLMMTLVISTPVMAFEKKLALKVAVVKDATGTQDIVKGNFNSSIKKLTRRYKNENSYNSNMSLCVAYLQADNAKKSELACTAAINDVEAMDLYNDKALYLKSLSYSNRGISRYKNKDISGALTDLSAAVLIDANTITVGNLTIVKKQLYKSQTLASTSAQFAE